MSHENRAKVLASCEQAFSQAKFEPVADTELSTEFDLALSEIDLRSTPGYGYNGLRYGGNNRNCLCNEDGSWNVERVAVLKSIVLNRLKTLSSQPYSDPIRVFVKQEALKKQKYEEKRWRIISAVSLEDTLVDRVLFTRFQKRFIEAAGNTPSFVGLNPCFGGFRVFMKLFGAGPYVCEDKSAWDWSVVEPLLELGLELILNLAVNPSDWWVSAVRARWDQLYKQAKYGFELGGGLVEQPYPGVVKSGCYLTIVLNTMLQYVLHALVNVSLKVHPVVGAPFCFGDDTLRKLHPHEEKYLSLVSSMGIKVKTELRDKPEFAGFEFDHSRVLPVYRSKHAFKVLHCPEETLYETMQAYQVLYAEDPGFFEWLHYVCRVTGNPQFAVSRYVATLVSRGLIPYSEAFRVACGDYEEC